MKKFIVEQKIRPLVNQYAIYDASSGSKGQMISFVQQKRLAFKEQIQFYTDSSKQQLLFTVRAEKVMDIHGKFLVTDTEGRQIGWLRKEFKTSLLRSTWTLSNDQTVLTVTESSKGFALFRRIWGFIPYIGDLPFVFKYHFSFLDANSNDVARYNKTTRLRDYYELDVTNNEVMASYDWRLLAAQCVLLDALQDR